MLRQVCCRNIRACNHIVVVLVFYVHCKTTILQHHIQKDARTYCTVSNATTFQQPYIDAIDLYCNQNSHIATQYRHHDRAGL